MFFSCKKQNDPTDFDTGYSYYPISEGDYSIYNVVDTIFEGVGAYSVDKYQIKEEVHAPITVNDEVRYQLYLYYKNEGEEWKSYPDSVWTVFNSNGRIVKVENNVRYVKLVFPFEVGKKWDGNISDPSSDPLDYYQMKNVRRPYTYDSFHYNSTVSVILFDNRSALDDNYGIEVFAQDKGLVYKEVKRYRYDQSNLIAKRVEFGNHSIQKLQVHGRYK